MAKAGRKPAKIDPGKLEILCRYGASCLDCADEFDCSEDTIVRYIKDNYGLNFKDYRKKKQGKVRMQLRQKQIEVALNGNVSMLIWLGKQILDQSDKVLETEDNGTRLIVKVDQETKDMLNERKKAKKEAAKKAKKA